ncbi:ArsR/SmtB family transcription factor [Natronoarchaeum mannanilyticum]|uniref:HTH iclR-type domain-containing protein n=1 Tax=Natronoarchaeum mannanilyticum TaxID=926360 RepID=A0AAV3T957_9EURY
MAENDCAPRSGRASENVSSGTERTIDVDELLAVLAEEYTEEILAALGEESAPAREIAESAGTSRPTVYRRLNRLVEVGAVETTMVPSPGGQRRKEFRLVLDEIEFPVVSAEDADEDESRQSGGENATPQKLAHATQ